MKKSNQKFSLLCGSLAITTLLSMGFGALDIAQVDSAYGGRKDSIRLEVERQNEAKRKADEEERARQAEEANKNDLESSGLNDSFRGPKVYAPVNQNKQPLSRNSSFASSDSEQNLSSSYSTESSWIDGSDSVNEGLSQSDSFNKFEENLMKRKKMMEEKEIQQEKEKKMEIALENFKNLDPLNSQEVSKQKDDLIQFD